MRSLFYKLLYAFVLIGMVASSSSADFPKAIVVTGWGSHWIESYDGIYVLAPYYTNSLNGEVYHMYNKSSSYYGLSIVDYNKPFYWYATAPYSGANYRQEYYTPDPTSPVRWERNSNEWFPPPQIYTMETPDSSKPDLKNALSKDPINTINGGMLLEESDMAIPCTGIPLDFTRYYNSGMYFTNSELGAGWSHNYDWSLTQTTRIHTASGIVFTNNCLDIRTGDGRVIELLQYGKEKTWTSYKDANWTGTLGTNAGYRIHMPPSSQWLFDSNGVLTSIQDHWGNTLTLIYTNEFPSNKLVRVDHSDSRYLIFSYTDCRLAGVDTPVSNLYVRYYYNGSGELTNAATHSSAPAKTTIYAYDGSTHCITQRINAVGEVFSYSYDTNGVGQASSRCIGMSLDDDYYKHGVSYHTNESYSDLTYYRGSTSQVYMNYYSTNMQRITKIVGPSVNLSTTITYEPMCLDAIEELTEDKTVSPNEFLRVIRSYDYRHNIIDQSAGYCAPATNTWQYTWHEVYQTPTSVTDPEGRKIEMDYTNDLPASVRLMDGASIASEMHFVYETNGLLAALTNANGHWARFQYDGWGCPDLTDMGREA